MSVHSLDLARARRELREAVGNDAEHVLADVRRILADAERDPDHCKGKAQPAGLPLSGSRSPESDAVLSLPAGR